MPIREEKIVRTQFRVECDSCGVVEFTDYHPLTPDSTFVDGWIIHILFGSMPTSSSQVQDRTVLFFCCVSCEHAYCHNVGA